MGVVEISASVAQHTVDGIQTDVTALAARLDDLELTTQPLLVNGPTP